VGPGLHPGELMGVLNRLNIRPRHAGHRFLNSGIAWWRKYLNRDSSLGNRRKMGAGHALLLKINRPPRFPEATWWRGRGPNIRAVLRGVEVIARLVGR